MKISDQSTSTGKKPFFSMTKADQGFNLSPSLEADAATDRSKLISFLGDLYKRAKKRMDEAEAEAKGVIARDNIDKNVLAYLAGFLDADGTIQVSTSRVSASAGYRFPFKFQLTVSYMQKIRRRSYLEDIQSTLGGVGNIRVNGPVCEYNITGNDTIKDLLVLLMPFLRAKKKQAVLALLFIEGTKKGLTPVEYLHRAKLVDEICGYNDSKNHTNTASFIKSCMKDNGLLTQEDDDLTSFI